MAIKADAARPWGDRPHTATTWYEPYVAADQVTANVRFVLSTPGVHAFCTPGDVDVAALALAAASDYRPLGPEERQAAMDRAAGEPHIFPIPAA
jgi:hypothetical protein